MSVCETFSVTSLIRVTILCGSVGIASNANSSVWSLDKGDIDTAGRLLPSAKCVVASFGSESAALLETSAQYVAWQDEECASCLKDAQAYLKDSKEDAPMRLWNEIEIRLRSQQRDALLTFPVWRQSLVALTSEVTRLFRVVVPATQGKGPLSGWIAVVGTAVAEVRIEGVTADTETELRSTIPADIRSVFPVDYNGVSNIWTRPVSIRDCRFTRLYRTSPAYVEYSYREMVRLARLEVEDASMRLSPASSGVSKTIWLRRMQSKRDLGDDKMWRDFTSHLRPNDEVYYFHLFFFSEQGLPVVEIGYLIANRDRICSVLMEQDVEGARMGLTSGAF